MVKDKSSTIYRNGICSNIRKFRECKGLSRSQVADHLQVALSAVSNWELGYNVPSVELLPDLCSLFNVSLYELLGVVDEDREITPREREMLSAYRISPFKSAIDKLLGILDS